MNNNSQQSEVLAMIQFQRVVVNGMTYIDYDTYCYWTPLHLHPLQPPLSAPLLIEQPIMRRKKLFV